MENNALCELCTVQFTYILQNALKDCCQLLQGSNKARLRTCGACLRARALILLHSKAQTPNKGVFHIVIQKVVALPLQGI